MTASARIRPAALTMHCVGHSGVSMGIGSTHGCRDGDTIREGERPSPSLEGCRTKIEAALETLRTIGVRPTTLRSARKALDAALGEANRARDTAARRSILRMRNWLTHRLHRMEAHHD